MNQKLALRVLSEVMGWTDERAKEEFRWLNLMSRMKYDGYRDYQAGARFVESLVGWIQQFEPADRETAYVFVRTSLVYIGPQEMQRLVEMLYPGEVQRTLAKSVAVSLEIPAYRVWADREASAAYDRLLRRTLFIGLSDGARLDVFRRANSGVINNEQIVVAAHVDEEKWDDLLGELRKAPGQPADARFGMVYLIDDFAGTGTTFIRKDSKTGKWKGKLWKFRNVIGEKFATHFDPGCPICVHHYVVNHEALNNLETRQREALADQGPEKWFPNVHFSCGEVLPPDLPICRSPRPEAVAFGGLAMRYYDPSIETAHTWEGGTDMRFGFSWCALPLVLEHNTPNNAVSLLWAESDGLKEGAHAMRPLFRRRQRHV